MITRGRWQRGQPGLTSMPAEVLQGIIAACPDQQEACLALQQTCTALRQAVESARTTLELRHFGRSGQVAPLLQHYTGVQHIVLGSCGAAAVPWDELAELRCLRSVTIPLAAAVSQLQPLSGLRQLVSLTFTSSQYGEATVVPLATVASLTRLTMLDASTCAPLGCPEMLQRMAVLRQLEVLRMPCTNPWALASLAAQLPHLCSLHLRLCCGDADTPEQLLLSAATALTELRMTATTDDTVLVQQMILPPRLQALHLDLTVRLSSVLLIAFLHALPLERLASLSVDGSGLNPGWFYNTPQPLRWLTGPPPLTQLKFDSIATFELLYRDLHPLAAKAASQHVCPGPNGRLAGAGTQATTSSGENSVGGSGWCLRLTCGGLEHELSVADILQREERGAPSGPAAVVHGCLVSATFPPGAPFRTVPAEGRVPWVLQDIFTHEKRLRRLAVHTKREALVGPVHFANPRARLGLGNTGFPSGGNVASLKRLEHLHAPGFNALDPDDCAALAAHPARFTFLHLPPMQESSVGLARALHTQARSLRDLTLAADLSADTLAVLQPLVALTRLRLGHTTSSMAPDFSRSRSWEDLDGHTFNLRRLETENMYNLSTPDHEFAATLPLMPWLQELRICGSANMTGGGLAVLPDACPLLRVLSLSTLPRLRVKHLRCVKRLEGLAVLDLCEVPLPKEAMRELARVLPPNLQALTLRRVHAMLFKTPWLGCDMKPEDVPPLLDAGLAAFLLALPSPAPPLRRLTLTRKRETPFRAPALAALAAAAAQLSTLERLDFSELDVAAGDLLQLSRLPALVELNAICSRGYDTQHGGSLQPRLDELQSAFALVKRPLLAVETKEEDGSHLWDPHDT